MPGQEHHQLDQPRRRRGKVRAGLPAGHEPTARALIVGTIDEDKLQAQAFTRERKLAVAQRSVKLLTEKYGIPPEDIIIDTLVFPCATGDENYIGGAVETIQAIRLVKERNSLRQDGARRLEHLLRPARRRARSGELGVPLSRDESRTRSGHRQRGETGTLRIAPRRRAPSGRGSALQHAARPIFRLPQDWREQTREQKIAINQFHIAAIS